MTSLSEMLLPTGFLVHCLNAAIASVVACAIAIALSRRSTWSLPVRHALLVAALAASLMTPLVIPLFNIPSFWMIRFPETIGEPRPSVATQSTGNLYQPEATEPAASISFPIADTSPSAIAEPAAPAAHDAIARGTLGLQFSTTARWASIIGTLLCGLWFAGVAIGTLQAIVCVARFRRWIQTISAAESPLLSAAARRAADGIGLRKEIAVYRSKLLPAPVTFGLIRPRIVVPAGIESILASDQLRAVIQHEMAHIARRDLWIGLLQQIVLIMDWWNPLVRLANRQLADLREQICDDIATRELAEPVTYATTLINIAERCSLCTPVPTTVGIGSSPARQLECRIRRIVSSPRATCVGLSRQARVGVLAATILMAATIVFAQVRIESPAAQGSADRIVTDQVEQLSGRPETVDATPSVKPEKPLTLDELRPLVIDQIRAIRSLYVAYSRTDPAEFGGKSHDYVWAEQGFKMLKYDMPSSSTVPYASTFDGKQTYVGGFQGDKPVRAYVKDELSPGFHQSLMGNALLGWLHFVGQRDSIVDLIRAPQATLVETPVADGTTRPTIEVKNFSRSGLYPLNAKIVLDPAHGFLPQTIAWDSVTDPDYRFAYEVDEFQQVRDGATGTDRWFPGKARYVQRTADRGEQVWIEKVTQLQVNDVLPDELFVLAPTSPTAVPGQEQQALAEFEKAYHLDHDQLVRRVKPPYLPGRMVNLKKWWANAFAQAPYEKSGTFLPMVYPERDGKLGQPGFNFTSGVGRAGIPASDLLNAVAAELKLWGREVDDPDNLLEPTVEGDFVIRADAPPEKVIAALGQLLKRECGVAVTLELREVEHPVIVVDGKIIPPFVIEPETVIELYTTAPQPSEGKNEQGTFGDFLQAVGRFIDPQRRIVNEVENSPYRQEKISWHQPPGAEKNGEAALGETEARAVLDHLEQQTGLTFKLNTRKFPTTYVKRSD